MLQETELPVSRIAVSSSPDHAGGGDQGRPAARCLGLEHAVAQVFGVAAGELIRQTRGKARSARARQVLMYLTHVAYGMSLTEVGSCYNRDRTTVAHACELIEDCRDDPAFDRALDLLELVAQAVNTPRFTTPS